jgi:histidinol-phosphatase (PHP family)
VRDNIESAISKGFVSLGISDHSYTACDESYCMMKSDYENYIKTVRALADEYAERIPVFVGLEKDFYSDIEREKFDYFLASIHYIVKNGSCYAIDHNVGHQEACINEVFGGSVMDFAKHFYEMVVKGAESCRPDIIGHFDVINKFSIMPEEDEEYQKIAVEAALEAAKYTKFFEVNTGGIARGYRTIPYPSPFVLSALRKAGAKLIITSDSHHPDNLDFAYDVAVKVIKDAGFDEVYNLTRDGYVPTKL